LVAFQIGFTRHGGCCNYSTEQNRRLEQQQHWNQIITKQASPTDEEIAINTFFVWDVIKPPCGYKLV